MTLPTATSDQDLLRQTRSGEAAAFQALYQRHQSALYRFALMRCGSADSAADVVQEAFMGILSGSLNYDPTRGQLQHFLFGVARNLILKMETASGRYAALPVDAEGEELELDITSLDAGPLDRMLSNELAEEVRRGLGLLPPHYRDALILYELHDLSYLEIADICKVDIGTIRSRLSRGRAALAKRLAAHRLSHAA